MDDRDVIDPRLRELLACPGCKGELELEEKESTGGTDELGWSELVCRSCSLAYRIEDGIPVMLIDEARRL